MLQLLTAIIFYIFTVLSVFWEPVINKFGSIQWDAVNVHFFNLFFSSETWNKGFLPLWTPYIFAGFPQIADLQVAFFYPINLLIGIFSIFTPELIMHQIILHYFFAGFFAFLLARYLSKNFWFSLAAGIVYSFGGFMAAHASHVGMQNTASWLPLIFLFLIIALKKAKTSYAALGGLFLSFAILAGHFQMSLYIAYAIAFYFIFDVAWTIAGSDDKTDNKKILYSVLHKVQIVSIIYIIAFLISAIQLLPTYELTQQSNRAKITLEMSQTESLNPKSLKSLIEPNYNNVSYGAPYTGPWDRTQNYLYLGSAIIMLAALGAIIGIFYRSTRKMTLFWLTLLILSLFYSFGEFGFLQKYFYRFAPFFDKIRAPANMMLLFNLSVIGLASSFFAIINNFFSKLENPPAAEKTRSTHNFLYVFGKIFFKRAPAFLGIISFLIIAQEILPAAELNTLLYSRQKTSEVFAVPPIALKIADEYSRLDEINKFRIFKVSGLDSNSTQMRHIFAFDGYNPLSLRRHANYTDAMVKNARLIDLAGIKYLPCEFIASRATDLEKIGTLCVNKNYSKLAFFIDDYILAENETESLQKTQEVDLEKIIVLEETPEKKTNGENYPKNDLPEKTNEISVVEFHPGFWRLAVKNDKSAFLFLSQANYPGWTAKIDDLPVKIYQADYLFQAVFVPGGKHEIIIKYEPRPLIIGTILTIIGLSSVFLIVLYDFCKKRKSLKRLSGN
ncbi:MAG: YfhO family protein [bacterium]|nr:YfhO family protein [bacterium]